MVCPCQFVIVSAFYPILPGVSSHDGMSIHPRFSVHFHPERAPDTLGEIIFIHSLRVTVAISLAKSDYLPRYQHVDSYINLAFTVFTRFFIIHCCIMRHIIYRLCEQSHLALRQFEPAHTGISALFFRLASWNQCLH